jgi:hypothetical protein
MLRRLEYICLVGTIALTEADRIDLLGGRGSFRLTPFFVLAALTVFLRLVIIVLERRLAVVTIPSIRRQMPFLVLLAAFLVLSSISTIFGLDPGRGLMQLAYIVLVSVFGYCISVLILADRERGKLVLRAVSLGLIIYLVFCIGECIAWSYGIGLQFPRADSEIAALFGPSSLLWVPRLSGPAIDANPAGFGLVMYLALLDAFVPKSRYTAVLRFAIAVFVLLAWSRSATLCWIAYYLFSRQLWRGISFQRAISWLAVLVVLCSFIWITYRDQIADAFEVWQISEIISARVATGDGSSGADHINLIRRGLETWSSSPRTMIAGIGLAAAPRVLGDYFGDDKYGNFHCLYVTVLAELGLPAFIVLMALLGYPLIARMGTASAIAAILTFNLPYQAHTNPMFWLILPLLWAFKPKLHHRPALAYEAH